MRTLLLLTLLTAAAAEGARSLPRNGVADLQRTSNGDAQIAAHDLITGLSMPVHVATLPGNLIAVVQLDGKVFVYDGGRRTDTLLDIGDRVRCCFGAGLLNFVLHPDFSRNGQAFAMYVSREGDTVISRFSRLSAETLRLDAASERVVLTIDRPPSDAPLHHGGELVFGPDHLLYISTGDGGSENNVSDNAQRLDRLDGKILRIDVDGAEPYSLPADNPFIGVTGARPEIWALGLRNPWRFSFHPWRETLLLPDIGQSRLEEVNITPLALSRGANFGWPHMEGTACFRPAENCYQHQLVTPRSEYSRADGCSITGGRVYRGVRSSRFRGLYLYGDWCSGKIWGIDPDAIDPPRLLAQTDYSIVGFGEDAAGELYIVDFNGRVGRLTDAPSARKRPVRK